MTAPAPSLMIGTPRVAEDPPLTRPGGPPGRQRTRRSHLSIIWLAAEAVTALDLQRRLPSGSFRPDHRSKRQLRETAVEALRSVPALAVARSQEVGFAGDSVARVQVLPTVSDLTVAIVERRGAHGSPVVLKIARTGEGAADLRRQSGVITALRADTRLQGWKPLLPDFQLGVAGNCDVAMESLIPGATLRELLDARAPKPPLVAAAARAIGRLHHSTATTATIDDDLLAHWVTGPLDLLGHTAYRWMGPVSSAFLERISHQLAEGLLGLAMPIGWSHGDFTPGNIFLEGGSVTGITDWGQADHRGLPVLDHILLLLTVRSQLERRQLGDLVRASLGGDGLRQADRAILEGSGAVLPGSRESERALILLCWLLHVAGNLQKSARYRDHAVWVASNVAPVLRTR